MTSRQQAPGDLGIIQAFVNTNDIEEGRDELATPALLSAWLQEHGLLAPGVQVVEEGERQRTIRVREALRALALANNGGPAGAADLGELDRAAASSRLQVGFRPDGRLRLEPQATGIDQALGRLLAIVAGAIAEGSWSRLKACRAHTCRWAFYDRSRNRSSTWCSMAVCGNRTKAQRFREKERAEHDH